MAWTTAQKLAAIETQLAKGWATIGEGTPTGEELLPGSPIYTSERLLKPGTEAHATWAENLQLLAAMPVVETENGF